MIGHIYKVSLSVGNKEIKMSIINCAINSLVILEQESSNGIFVEFNWVTCLISNVFIL